MQKESERGCTGRGRVSHVLMAAGQGKQGAEAVHQLRSWGEAISVLNSVVKCTQTFAQGSISERPLEDGGKG